MLPAVVKVSVAYIGTGFWRQLGPKTSDEILQELSSPPLMGNIKIKIELNLREKHV